MAGMLRDWLLLAGGRTWDITGYTWNPIFSTLTVSYWNGVTWSTYFRSYSPPATYP